MAIGGPASTLGLLERALRCARDVDPQIRATCRRQVTIYLEELHAELRPALSQAEVGVVWEWLRLCGRAFHAGQWATVWGSLQKLYQHAGEVGAAAECGHLSEKERWS